MDESANPPLNSAAADAPPEEPLKIEGAAAPVPELTPAAPAAPLDEAALEALRAMVIAALRTVYDPEIPINIYELGLIYNVAITEQGLVAIDMTLTAPACPAAGSLPGEVEAKVRAVPGVSDVLVEIVWEPAWSKEMMSEDARLLLGL